MSEVSKTVLVTGATGGIGLAVCHRLAKAGNSLILAARDAGKLQSLCTELSNRSRNLHMDFRRHDAR